jgi:small-conductance mechanosensitive channel
LRLLILLLISLLVGSPAPGQTNPSPSDAEVAQSLDKAASDLRALALGADRASLSDEELKRRLAAVAPIQATLANAASALAPKLKDTDARLAQLGAAPTAAQPPESAATAAARRTLVHAREALDGELKQARLLAVEADQTNKAIVRQLHVNFSSRLWTRGRSALNPALWRESAVAVPRDAGRVLSILGDEADKLSRVQSPLQKILLAMTVMASAFLLWPAPRLLRDWGLTHLTTDDGEPVSRLRRSALALWMVVLGVVLPLLAGQVLRLAFRHLGGASNPFDDLIEVVVRAFAYAGLVESLGRALLMPSLPGWRLAPLSEAVVRRLAPFPLVIGVAVGLSVLAAGLNNLLGSSLASSVASDILTVIAEILAVGAALVALGRSREEEASAPMAGDPPEDPRWPWVLCVFLAWTAVGLSVLALLAGYLALARFLMRETLWIGTILALVFLLLRLSDHFLPALLDTDRPLGRTVRTMTGLRAATLEQLAVVLSGLLRLAFLLLGLAAILASFGASAEDLLTRIAASRFVFKVGQLTVSPGLILGGVAVFLGALAVTRAVRAWLEERYLPTTDLDIGARSSLSVAVNYLGIALSVAIAFAFLGLNLSQIALFASALSVGIGFGLQSIIGNFVSGLILLAERPVKVGDWVAIGDLEGDVRAINIRATEIEMFDRSKLLVPNSELISKTVRNVTQSGAIARIRILLRLDSAADPVLARSIILQACRNHPEALGAPEPAVYLTDARDGGLEFTAHIFVASARRLLPVRSDILVSVISALRAAGIAQAPPVVAVAGSG